MKYYQLELPEPTGTNIAIPVTVGEYSFSISFQWPDEIQEIWDEFQRSMASLGADDPLVTPMGYMREYDYIQLYSSITDVAQWLASDVYKPLSVMQASEAERNDMVQQKVDECKELVRYENELKEHLKWTALIEDMYGNKTSAVVEPGGWYRNQSNDYSFRFLSDKDYIGYEDLMYVSMMFRMVE